MLTNMWDVKGKKENKIRRGGGCLESQGTSMLRVEIQKNRAARLKRLRRWDRRT